MLIFSRRSRKYSRDTVGRSKNPLCFSLHQDTHTNPACGVGVNIQLALQSFYMDIQQAAENRMRQITLRDILDQYHARVKESSK